ncbi:MAG: membrane protein insertion efficiency factor YidD [Clostridiales bacterium]|nr:membrane protein insertion efficiency factor YidD [Clostridiales bacterium]
MEMPSQEEQMIVERYVLERELERPDTDVKKAAKYVCGFAVISVASSIASFHVFRWLGIFALLPDSFIQFQTKHSTAFCVLYCVIVVAVMGLLSLKRAVIGVVRLYQHYAPEDIRRRCLFKPTCSEYAILAIKKYGLVIGLLKAYIRVVYKCRGNIYRIDYP